MIPQAHIGKPERLIPIRELAGLVDIPHYVLAEWVHQGLLPTPIVVGLQDRMGRNGARPKAYGYLQRDLPEVRRLVVRLKQNRLHPKEATR